MPTKSSPIVWAPCMISLLCSKVAVQLAHLLHAFSFLLNLSLLTLLVRIILTLNLDTIISNSLCQGLRLNLFKAFIRLDLFFFLLANLIIMALFFTSKGGSLSSSQASTAHFEDNDDDLPYDSLAIATNYHNIPSNELAISTAPAMEQLLSSKVSPLIHNNQLELVPVYSQENSSIINPRSDSDVKNCEYSPCNTLLAIASAPSMELIACRPDSGSMSISSQEELLRTIPPENPSQKTLSSRCMSDKQVTARDCNYVANKYRYYGRTVSCTYYYETDAQVYTASNHLDSLSKEEANKRFSEFASRNWAKIRKGSQAADCSSALLCINSA